MAKHKNDGVEKVAKRIHMPLALHADLVKHNADENVNRPRDEWKNQEEEILFLIQLGLDTRKAQLDAF